MSKRRSDIISYEDAMADMMRFVERGADVEKDDFNDEEDVDLVIDDKGLPLNDETDEDLENEIENTREEEENFRVINRKILTRNCLVDSIEAALDEKNDGSINYLNGKGQRKTWLPGNKT